MAVRAEHAIHINAPPAKVWEVMTDIERWPEWTPSVTRAERGDRAPFGMGSTTILDVKSAPTAVWTVTEFTPGASFTWEATTRGVHVRAAHVIDPEDDGSRVTLTTVSEGIIATLFFPLIIAVNRRNLKMEAEGLKKRCEADPA